MIDLRYSWAGLGVLLSFAAHAGASNPITGAAIEREVQAVAAQAIAWRRDIHEHPELGYQETRTAGLVTQHLRSLGIEVIPGLAHTGVIGVLRGASPGPTVALRTELDALPVTEAVDLPFASKARVSYHGQDTGVMHACGHDVHIAALMGTATVLSRLRAQLHGTVVFIFQPDEEQTADPKEKGGAALMLAEGLLEKVHPTAVFSLHVSNQYTVGDVRLSPGAAKAGTDGVEIVVTGKQVHAARPWEGVDPIVTASQIVLGLQTVISRQVDPTVEPAVLSIGMIHGGIRPNIIPETVTLSGGLRWFGEHGRMSIREKVDRVVQGIAASAGATATVTFTPLMPPVANSAELARAMSPTLSDLHVAATGPSPTSDDVAYLMQRIPGLYLYLGGTPLGVDTTATAANHSPRFFVDEGAVTTGIRVMSRLAADYVARDPRVR
jgi:amidohydrolase